MKYGTYLTIFCKLTALLISNVDSFNMLVSSVSSFTNIACVCCSTARSLAARFCTV